MTLVAELLQHGFEQGKIEEQVRDDNHHAASPDLCGKPGEDGIHIAPVIGPALFQGPCDGKHLVRVGAGGDDGSDIAVEQDGAHGILLALQQESEARGQRSTIVELAHARPALAVCHRFAAVEHDMA